MYKNQKILAIIPARGGSKRLPNKNILNLNGKPLITWTINAARSSKYIDHIYVSTDSVDIMHVSEKEGVPVPELRPDSLANDTAGTFPVVEYTVSKLKKQGLEFDITVLLQPTSPLRQAQDIDTAIKFFFDKDATAVISVTEMEHSPLWSNTLPEDLSMDNFLNADVVGRRSQDLSRFYRLNGAIYINNISELLKQKKFIFDNGSYAFVMERIKSIDIDDYLDLKFAELIMREALDDK